MHAGTEEKIFDSSTNTTHEDPLEYCYGVAGILERSRVLKMWDPTGVLDTTRCVNTMTRST